MSRFLHFFPICAELIHFMEKRCMGALSSSCSFTILSYVTSLWDDPKEEKNPKNTCFSHSNPDISAKIQNFGVLFLAFNSFLDGFFLLGGSAPQTPRFLWSKRQNMQKTRVFHIRTQISRVWSKISKNATVGFCTGLLSKDPPFHFSHSISVPVQKSRFSFAKSAFFRKIPFFTIFRAFSGKIVYGAIRDLIICELMAFTVFRYLSPFELQSCREVKTLTPSTG